jgi:acetyl-CoA synthetase
LLEPVWTPDAATVAAANVTDFAAAHGLGTYDELHRWSVAKPGAFWGAVAHRLGIVFRTLPTVPLDPSGGVEQPRFFPGARLNIVESCFAAPGDQVAIVHDTHGTLERVTYDGLRTAVDRVANGLLAAGFQPGDRIAIAMAMSVESVYAYLGIVAFGGVVVSIADSFAPHEIETRLGITDAVGVITQDVIHRAGRTLPMYEKVVAAGPARRIVIDTGAGLALESGDVWWRDFLGDDTPFEPAAMGPTAHTNVLFSSGTTGDPKAIPWSQLTPLKGAMDAHFHHDVHPGDVVAWPTNLGWMMGPWLIYASLLNRATMALHGDAPTGRSFGEFVAAAGVTMLGVVPSLVATWRSTGCLDGLDWSRVRRFSSTGEASNPDDMHWLIEFAGGKPVIEYCGGTELGGGYLAATMVHPNIPSTFSTATLGIDVRLFDTDGVPTDSGEVYLLGPSIGFSTELLNRDHHREYYAGTPSPNGEVLRRHGDHIERLPNGYYRAQGRVDDTMNLGGIKVSSAEIERVIAATPGVSEVAAVAVSPPEGGPSRLVVFAVPEEPSAADPEGWREVMQAEIRDELNPLFRIHEVVVAEALPRTASAKVMRRTLRRDYETRS